MDERCYVIGDGVRIECEDENDGWEMVDELEEDYPDCTFDVIWEG